MVSEDAGGSRQPAGNYDAPLLRDQPLCSGRCHSLTLGYQFTSVLGDDRETSVREEGKNAPTLSTFPAWIAFLAFTWRSCDFDRFFLFFFFSFLSSSSSSHTRHDTSCRAHTADLRPYILRCIVVSQRREKCKESELWKLSTLSSIIRVKGEILGKQNRHDAYRISIFLTHLTHVCVPSWINERK